MPVSYSTVWTLPLKLLYYTGLVSYKAVYDGQLKQWTLKERTVKYQALSFIFIWSSFVTGFLRGLSYNVDGFLLEHRSAKTYFSFLSSCLQFVKYWLSCSVLFGKSKEHIELVNLLNIGYLQKPMPIGKQWRCQSRLRVVLTYTGCACLVRILIESDVCLIKKLFVNPSKAISELFQTSEKKFYLHKIGYPYPITFLDYLFTVFQIWEQYTLRLQFWALEFLLAGPIPSTIWLATKHFEELVWRNQESISNPGVVLDSYKQLKGISGLVNVTWANVFLISVFQTCLWLMLGLDEQVETRDFLNNVHTFSLLVFCTVAVILSGEVNKMTEQFQDWLLDRRNWKRFISVFGSDAVHRLLLELQGSPIGISVMGMYRWTYGYMAQVGIVVITVFVISFDK